MSKEYARRQSWIKKNDAMSDNAIVNYFASEWLALGYSSDDFEKLKEDILKRLKEKE